MGSFRKLLENWCEETVEDGFGSNKGVGRTRREHRGCRNVEIDEASGRSSRREGVGFAFPFHGSEKSCR